MAGTDDVKLTAEEAKQLEAAFKDDAFCRLLSEYAAEIADPKNMQETEEYISLLESQQELPAGKSLVRPTR